MNLADGWTGNSRLDVFKQQINALLVTFLIVKAASFVWDAPGQLFCDPGVPWRVELFLLGAYTLPVLSALGQVRGKPRHAFWAYLCLVWIAPWYGFFNGAVLAGAGLALECPGRTWMPYAAAFAGGIPATYIGVWLGRWTGRSEPMRSPWQTL
ncbi:MAG: hypothetical protein K5872_05745 [Rhizobiaceae bacterium]|nr:hypothetical protein [Rhizobiaceae bacterium]MCV0405714.1 hypothetical protein [Rhizobiaceae bacterium]